VSQETIVGAELRLAPSGGVFYSNYYDPIASPMTGTLDPLLLFCTVRRAAG
jgi:hypothetical protein